MESRKLIEEISDRERIARQLEPDAATRKLWMEKAFAYADRFIEGLPMERAFIQPETDFHYRSEKEFPQKKSSLDSLLQILEEDVDHIGLNPASGGHLGYIPGGGIFPSALGDFLSDVFNRYAGIHFASPGAVEMEHEMTEWIRRLFGFPESARGTLTSGGSIANLIAVVTARDAKKISARDIPNAVIYLSEQVHHCVYKAIRIAGMAESHIRHVPLDEHFRMDMKALQELLKEDKAAGKIPFLLVGSAGTTDTGSIDPLETMAEIAAQENLWFHIDAAYGGFFMLTDQGKSKLKGIEKADSLVVDPHKGLFLPYGLGAVLIRDWKHLYDSHYYNANYMQDANRNPKNLSPADLSPELTRPFRALRMWLPLKLFGIEPFRAALEEKLLLAQYFRQEIRKLPGMETGEEPDLSVVIFRIAKGEGDLNKQNEGLVAEIHKDGRVFLSSTRIKGEVWIRLACLSFRTHKETIDLALEVIVSSLKKMKD